MTDRASDSLSQNEASEELRQEIHGTILLGLAPIGYLIIIVAEIAHWTQGVSLFGVALMVLPLPLWLLSRRYPSIGRWLLILGYVGAIFVAISWHQSASMLSLLSLPILWATLMIGQITGVIFAILAVGLVVLAGPLWGIHDLTASLAIIILIFEGTVCFLVTALSSREALEWSQSRYQQLTELLVEARDQRLQLKQAQADLLQANTELARLSDRLDALRFAAEQARRAKEDFVASVSHELRTPLNMIIGFSELLSQAPEVYGAELPSSVLADVTVIYRNSQHLAGLVNDVLDLSQVETHKMILNREESSVEEIVRAAMEAVEPLFQKKDLYLRCELPMDLPKVYCDRVRIRQVILNLLSNAARFTEYGGVQLHAYTGEHELIISVTDTGPGIPEEDHGRIFEPFHQSGDSILRRHDGSGLGLSISRRFVELHAGRMWMESKVGLGSTFHFAIPLEKPASVEHNRSAARWFDTYPVYEPRRRPSTTPVSEPRPRFVVIEKGNDLQRLLRRVEDQAEIVAVSGREEAIDVLTRAPANALLINDVCMNMASQSWNWFTELPYGTPAIACHVPSAEEAASQIGVQRYLTKPITRDNLLSALNDLDRPIRTILLVDDQPEALQLFARMLSSSGRGYRILRALSGTMALELARERYPDVILLDLVMPEMNGYQVLQTKAMDETICDIPVIAITAQDMPHSVGNSYSLAIGRGGGLLWGELLASLVGMSARLLPTTSTGYPESAERPRG